MSQSHSELVPVRVGCYERARVTPLQVFVFLSHHMISFVQAPTIVIPSTRKSLPELTEVRTMLLDLKNCEPNKPLVFISIQPQVLCYNHVK
jgi:hypothetical protein